MIKTNLVIASKNLGKIKEFSEFLSIFPLNIIRQPNDFDVEETGKTFAENARLKAETIAKRTGELSLADDSGLCVNSLSGAPGIRSARYAENDKERINRLLNELRGSNDRSAVFISCLCLSSLDKKVCIEVEGRCEGRIIDLPRGENGFGYDPVFEVKDCGLTFAEMDKQKKKLLGHRGKAFELLKPLLRDILASQIRD